MAPAPAALLASPCGSAATPERLSTARPARRPLLPGRRPWRGSRGHGPGRRRRPEDTVRICHFADGAYEAADAPETSFYGDGGGGHAGHGSDIVPPFTVENPRPGDRSSFDGRHWDDRGQAIYDAGCVAASTEGGQVQPDKKVRICHRTSSESNPYTSLEAAIANNGDLNGGHLEHTGPVYPADGWGDIIPPYTYVDKNGETQTFPGYNWSDAGQAIYGNGCEPSARRRPSRSPRSCSASRRRTAACSPTSDTAIRTRRPSSHPAGENFFSPSPANRGQPTSLRLGHGRATRSRSRPATAR